MGEYINGKHDGDYAAVMMLPKSQVVSVDLFDDTLNNFCSISFTKEQALELAAIILDEAALLD